MKRNLFIALMLVCIFAFAGCGDKKVEESNSDNKAAVEEKVTEEPKKEEASTDISYADMLPNVEDYFANATMNVTDGDGGTAYIFNLENFTFDEVYNYWVECKNLGFTNVEYEFKDSCSYGAYSSNKEYWLQIGAYDDDKKVSIVCQKSKKE